jgi:hypothetical protein
MTICRCGRCGFRPVVKEQLTCPRCCLRVEAVPCAEGASRFGFLAPASLTAAVLRFFRREGVATVQLPRDVAGSEA